MKNKNKETTSALLDVCVVKNLGISRVRQTKPKTTPPKSGIETKLNRRKLKGMGEKSTRGKK